MKTYTFDEFWEYYENHGRFPINSMSIKTNGVYNDKQKKSVYDKYLKKIDKLDQQKERVWQKQKEKEIEIDTRWFAVREEVYNRDSKECQLQRALFPGEYKELVQTAEEYQLDIIDPAHYLSRAAYPEFKYEVWNIYCLNRYSHFMIDNFKHPITGKSITSAEKEYWWSRIIGIEKYTEITKKLKEATKWK